MMDPFGNLAEMKRGSREKRPDRRTRIALALPFALALMCAFSCHRSSESLSLEKSATTPAVTEASGEASMPGGFDQSIVPARPKLDGQPIVSTSRTDAVLEHDSSMAHSNLAKGASLECARRFHRPQSPVEIRVVAPHTHAPLTIQVLDTDGHSLGETGVTPGIVDIRPIIPGLDQLPKAVWVQLCENAVPIGSPIVLEPLRSPPSARTMRSLRKGTNDPYTRVVGWGDRMLNPQDQEVIAASTQWIPSEPVVVSGFRTEMDVDAVLMTDAGAIRIAFAPDAAPATVRNFVSLADQGFYNNTVFHRIVPMNREGQPFVIQGGDPTSTGDGGPGWNLALEPSDLPHDIGVVGMARGDDPHSAGSQFYIALSREGTARLDGQYCTFGYVVSGRDALLTIARANIADASSGRPTDAPRIQEVIIAPAPARIPGENRRQQRIRSDGR